MAELGPDTQFHEINPTVERMADLPGRVSSALTELVVELGGQGRNLVWPPVALENGAFIAPSVPAPPRYEAAGPA